MPNMTTIILFLVAGIIGWRASTFFLETVTKEPISPEVSINLFLIAVTTSVVTSIIINANRGKK